MKEINCNESFFFFFKEGRKRNGNNFQLRRKILKNFTVSAQVTGEVGVNTIKQFKYTAWIGTEHKKIEMVKSNKFRALIINFFYKKKNLMDNSKKKKKRLKDSEIKQKVSK